MRRNPQKAELVGSKLSLLPELQGPRSTSRPGCVCAEAGKEMSPRGGGLRALCFERTTSLQPSADRRWQEIISACLFAPPALRAKWYCRLSSATRSEHREQYLRRQPRRQ